MGVVNFTMAEMFLRLLTPPIDSLGGPHSLYKVLRTNAGEEAVRE